MGHARRNETDSENGFVRGKVTGSSTREDADEANGWAEGSHEPTVPGSVLFRTGRTPLGAAIRNGGCAAIETTSVDSGPLPNTKKLNGAWDGTLTAMSESKCTVT